MLKFITVVKIRIDLPSIHLNGIFQRMLKQPFRVNRWTGEAGSRKRLPNSAGAWRTFRSALLIRLNQSCQRPFRGRIGQGGFGWVTVSGLSCLKPSRMVSLALPVKP